MSNAYATIVHRAPRAHTTLKVRKRRFRDIYRKRKKSCKIIITRQFILIFYWVMDSPLSDFISES